MLGIRDALGLRGMRRLEDYGPTSAMSEADLFRAYRNTAKPEDER